MSDPQPGGLPALASPETRPFWEGCAAGELRLQRCAACGSWQFPPRPFCGTCRAPGPAWVRASGRARLASFTEVHRAPRPEMRSATPYLLALVDLEEGPRMMTTLTGANPARLRIGQPLEAVFGTPGPTPGPLPLFRPSPEDG